MYALQKLLSKKMSDHQTVCEISKTNSTDRKASLRSKQNQRYYRHHKNEILARRRLLHDRIEQLETFIKDNGLVPPDPRRLKSDALVPSGSR
ncbi:10124_t:CDS:2 [Acaulospora colombiana]|uniref:10124_t:CDS:1 n=1 Tax=Acaulospora colombiana TaxID=27376 RepID=A0ACA9KHF7_9GLOM|nr:10124_t:CDS:2 [Acaulospora colombiana]